MTQATSTEPRCPLLDRSLRSPEEEADGKGYHVENEADNEQGPFKRTLEVSIKRKFAEYERDRDGTSGSAEAFNSDVAKLVMKTDKALVVELAPQTPTDVSQWSLSGVKYCAHLSRKSRTRC